MQEQPFEMNEYEMAPDAAAGAGGMVGGAIGCVCWLIYLALIVLMIVGMWKIFVKAGQPGWASIIPFYNAYVLTVEIARRPILWFILWFIPCVNIFAIVVITIDVARNFGKDTIYAVGLILFPFIFYPLLGFSDAQYKPVAPTGGI